jgi:hypothetical protein
MRYLLLVYEDERRWEQLPANVREALAQACEDSEAALRASGYLLGAELPHGAAAAVTVSVRGAGISVTPGPATETPQQLRALVTISARDLNEAIQVAASLPQARIGPIEVRPLRERGP